MGADQSAQRGKRAWPGLPSGQGTRPGSVKKPRGGRGRGSGVKVGGPHGWRTPGPNRRHLVAPAWPTVRGGKINPLARGRGKGARGKRLGSGKPGGWGGGEKKGFFSGEAAAGAGGGGKEAGGHEAFAVALARGNLAPGWGNPPAGGGGVLGPGGGPGAAG